MLQQGRGRSVPALVGAGTVVAVLALTGVASAQAPGLGDRFRTGPEVTVPAGETVADDLYATGGRVRIDGVVQGDVVVAGGEVEIGGTVEDDVLVAGGRVTISGDVGGDVRAAGGEVHLQGSVAQDALLTGGQLTVSSGGRVGADLIFSGGQMALDGTVDGDAVGNAGTYRREGTVGGEERVSTPPREEREPTAADRVLRAVRRYVGVLIVGALLLWAAPRLMRWAARQAWARPLPSLGVGVLGFVGSVLALIALVIAAVLLSLLLDAVGLGGLVAIVIFGVFLAVAALVFALALTVAFAADALVGVAVGRRLLGDRGAGTRAADLIALAIGAAILVALTALPGVGGLVKLLVVCVGLGAILLALRRREVTAPPA